jgi:hypothetical protein
MRQRATSDQAVYVVTSRGPRENFVDYEGNPSAEDITLCASETCADDIKAARLVECAEACEIPVPSTPDIPALEDLLHDEGYRVTVHRQIVLTDEWKKSATITKETPHR